MPVTPIGSVVRLKLQEIIHRAAANNLDARVASYDSAIDEARILEAKSQFDPTFFSQLITQRQIQSPGTGLSTTTTAALTNPLNLATSDSQQLQTGVRQLLPNGAQVELRGQTTRTDVTGPNGAFGSINPYYQDELVLQITQPLLKNFGGDVNRARITIARNDQKISSLEWRSKLEDSLLRIEEAYWRLYQATLNVKIEELLVARSEDTLDILIKRLKQDTSRVHVSQAFATLEARRATLIRTKSQISDLSDQIKRLMNDPEFPVTSPVIILPADDPVLDAIQFSLVDQMETALQSRLDLMQQKLRIDSASTIVTAAKNNVLPQLNLVCSAGTTGFGGGFSSAYDNATDSTDSLIYSAGFTFEVPFGNRGPRAIYQRTLLQRQQAIEQYRLLVDTTALEVKTSMRAVETAWDQIIATRRARFAAEDALAAIEQRERAGEQLTPTFLQLKLDRQASLAETQTAEAEAIASYNIQLAALEKAKGTLLKYNNVLMKEEQGPGFLSAKGAKRIDQSK
jgi:outer membrane protein TolC